MIGHPAETRRAPGNGRWNLWIGLGILVFAATCLLIWFPQDIGSGFLQKNLTGKIVPGDSFFPVLLIGLMMPLALLLLFSQLGTKHGKSGEPVGRIGVGNLGFLARSAILTGLSLWVMNMTGPLLIRLTNSLNLTSYSGYRAASATFPFDISGFFVGGTMLTCGFIWLTHHRLTLRHLVIGAAAVAILILLFDGLLNDLQLPPNADL